MKAVFLSSSSRLTKTFTLENGEIKKSGHPRVTDCTSYIEEYETIEEFFELLKKHADQGHCFLKGQITRDLVNESRAGATDPMQPTTLLLLDLDGLKSVGTPDDLLRKIGAADCDYIVQYSSSMGVLPERGLSAHIFVFLDKPYAPALIKQWLIHLNLTDGDLRKDLSLTRTNNAIRWGLDITTCQNDKLIYITPPILGPGVKDEFSGERIQLVKRKNRTFSLPTTIPPAGLNQQLSEVALNELRAVVGLPKRKTFTMKIAEKVEYLPNPDRAIVTGIRTERGFTYLNINGGDSWGYYHPEDKFEFIYNFKSEPNYRTAELLPDYYAQACKERGTPKTNEEGIMYLAFRDFKTASYYNAIWDAEQNDLKIAQAKNKDQLRDFLRQHGQDTKDFTPNDWDLLFLPSSDVVVDIPNKILNTYRPSFYMRLAPEPESQVPPIISKVINHALGGEEQAVDRMYNWLAVILQHKQRTNTAWILNGIQGTGKGVLLNSILRPLYGMEYVVSKRMEELESQFNAFMEQCFILWIDEARMASYLKSEIMNANIKHYIVEPKINCRRMYALPFMTENYMNLIFASNDKDPVVITPDDRRFNVGAFQSEKLILTEAEFREIENELLQFYNYLSTRYADIDMAREPLNNSAKQAIISLSQTSVDVVCDAILKGSYAFLKEQEPENFSISTNSAREVMSAAYIDLLKEIAAGKKAVLTREEVQLILGYTIGGVPESPYKFSSYVKHHGIVFSPQSVDGKTVRGIKVNWIL